MIEPFVELADRTLRFDGVSVLDPANVQHFILSGLKPQSIRVLELSEELQDFNSLVSSEDRISTEVLEEVKFDLSWKIPPSYLSLNIDEHVTMVFRERLPTLAYDSAQIELAITRVAEELEEYKSRKLHDLLRVIIFILDRFRETGQVYGVGRGSSCASYILFLLGLHVVDSIKYAVPIEEFFHE